MVSFGGFERPLALLLLVLILPLLYNALSREDRFKRVASLIHALLLTLLILAVAGPTLVAQQQLHEEPRLTVLVDDSMSTSVLERSELDFQGVEVRRRVVASGNSSDLRQGILQNLEENTNYVAVSDFQSEEGLDGLAERFNEVNSTLNAVRLEGGDEYAVRVEGPGTTVPGADTRFRVAVSSTEDTLPEPEVELDGDAVELEEVGEGEWEFTTQFDSEGSHRITASIGADDQYELNDRYHKTVEVAEKPEILVLGGQGGLGAGLERFYDVTYQDAVPEDADQFYAVVAKRDVEGLERYVLEGNGLVYTGDPGEKSMGILPVKAAPGKDRTSGTKVVLAIDISVSTEGSGVKRSKQIAYNLVELLPFNNRVGAIAYNRDAFLVSEPEALSLNREKLKDRIARLEPSGPSFHDNGIEGGEELLNGTGNIVWISDGKIGGLGANTGVPDRTREAAENLDVRLIAVAVGEDANRGFMQDIASRADGMFLDASEAGRLEFVFGAGGAAGEAARLVVVDPDHFITEGERLTGSATAFDPVTPRKGADLLVTGVGGKPFLTSWRYGLGRVAAFSGGDPELTRLREQDPSLLLRAVSWSVGDPDRKEERWVDVPDGYTGEAVEVTASYPVEGLRRQSSDRYTGELHPETRGFHRFAGESYAYTYNPELSRVGYRSIEPVVRRTGGEVFSADDTDALRDEAVRFSSRAVPTKTSATNYVLILALLVFLVEVGYRKWNGRM